MKAAATRQNRRLLLRLYLLLAVGLIAVAALLDVGFRELQSRLHPAEDPWREAGLDLIAESLAAVNPAERPALARRLAATAGMPVQVLEAVDVVGDAAGEAAVQELFDADGRVTWLLHDPANNLVVRVGPLALPGESPWLQLIPPLFYLAIFVLIALWLRPLLKDLDTITGSTRRFAADYRNPEVTAPAVSSLKELAENFDAMAARLSSLIQGQKELSSALSHEMRTPLARIRFALAVIADKASDTDRQELDAISDDVQEIDRLIATMLDYARLDHPDTRMQWQDEPADAWLDEIAAKSRLPGIALDKAVDARSNVVTIDRRLMTLALSNLLVNACRHAASKVAITLETDDDGHCLQVHDDGEGIPEDSYLSVFKAFTRLDGSRNRDTGGSGLGLAIVARIANLHGGDAVAGRSERLGGACLTIRWRRPR